MSAISSSHGSVLTKSERDTLKGISDKYQKAKENLPFYIKWLSKPPVFYLNKEEQAVLKNSKKLLTKQLTQAFRFLESDDLALAPFPLKQQLEKTIHPVVGCCGGEMLKQFFSQKENFLIFGLLFNAIKNRFMGHGARITYANGLLKKISVMSSDKEFIAIKVATIIEKEREIDPTFFHIKKSLSQKDAQSIQHEYAHANQNSKNPHFKSAAFQKEATPFWLTIENEGDRYTYDLCTGFLNVFFNEKEKLNHDSYMEIIQNHYNPAPLAKFSAQDQAQKEACYLFETIFRLTIEHLCVGPLFRSINDGNEAQALLSLDKMHTDMLQLFNTRTSALFLTYHEKNPFLPRELAQIVASYLKSSPSFYMQREIVLLCIDPVFTQLELPKIVNQTVANYLDLQPIEYATA